MKYTLLILYLVMAASAFSQQPERILPRQARVRFDIITLLGKDGMQPKTDANSKIVFTHAGAGYSLELSEDQNSLYYVRLSMDCKFLPDTLVGECVEAFNREFNYKLVKVVAHNGKCSIRSEFLLDDVSYFKNVYRRLMNLMIRVYDSLQVKCRDMAHAEPVVPDSNGAMFIECDSLRIESDTLRQRSRITPENKL